MPAPIAWLPDVHALQVGITRPRISKSWARFAATVWLMSFR